MLYDLIFKYRHYGNELKSGSMRFGAYGYLESSKEYPIMYEESGDKGRRLVGGLPHNGRGMSSR